MGNKPSAQARPVVVAPRPAASSAAAPPAACDVALLSVGLNQANQDVKTAQTKLDSCNPAAALARTTTAAMATNQAYVDTQRSRFNELLKANTTASDIYHSVRDAVTPIVSVGSDIDKETKKVEAANRKYLHAQRKERRNFVDTDPLTGVGGSPGVRTSDDAVILAFWITFGAALIIAVVFLLNTYGAAMALKEKIMTGAGVVAVSYGIVYYLITQYG